jgi:hypothetical protein
VDTSPYGAFDRRELCGHVIRYKGKYGMEVPTIENFPIENKFELRDNEFG